MLPSDAGGPSGVGFIASEDPGPATGWLPPGCGIADRRLTSGGCDVVDLVERFGTPLYIFNEMVIRDQCRAYRRAFASYGGGTTVAYAAKAFLSQAIAAIIASEGLHLDVVSGGELYTALQAGFPAARIYFHGNNKSVDEIAMACDAGIGSFVVDNAHELERVDAQGRARGQRQRVLLRVAPGIEAHTHEYVRTGMQDSKFGFDLESGQALAAAQRAAAAPGIELVGLHAHIGSQILDTSAMVPLAQVLVALASEIRRRTDVAVREVNLGGGAGIRYRQEEPPSPAAFAAAMAEAMGAACSAADFRLPRLAVEPGRSIVGEAALAVYRVGSQKHVPGLVPYIAVDGGMGDNIRPSLYGAEYTVVVANRMGEPSTQRAHIVGRYCESGDFLARSVPLPAVQADDLLSFFSAGAYQLPMASNYNRVPRPCVLLVREGHADVMVERETFADLDARERLPERLRTRGVAAAT